MAIGLVSGGLRATTLPAPPGPGPSGDPAPGYVAWFKADGMTSLNNGDHVETWEDSGPGGLDATQATASSQPTYRTGIVGGRPAIHFDGVDDRLVSPPGSDIWGLTNHFTVFAVVRLDANPGTAGQDIVGSSSISNNLDLIARRSEVNGNWLAHSSTQDGARNSDLVLTPGTWYVLTWRLKAFEHIQIRANEMYRLNDTSYQGSGTAPSQVGIGARDNGVSPFKGDIAEVIFYTTSLSDVDMEATEGYLLDKYGLAGSQPPDPPSELQAFPSGYYQVTLTWEDNSSNEGGFKIERRQDQAEPWIEIAMLGTDTSLYVDHDPPLVPGMKYCYRVVAFGEGGDSGYSNGRCATTPAFVPVDCTPDDGGKAREELLNILLGPGQVDWKNAVGLASVDPDQLVLLTDDDLCQQLWNRLAARPPLQGFLATFFQLGDRYIMTLYVDPSGNANIHTFNHTAVFDLQFNLLDGVLQR